MWRSLRNISGATVLCSIATISGAKCLNTRKDSESEKPLTGGARVAVVGAGVGGCSSAYFLRRLCGDQLELDVFEKAVVGGRTDVIEYDGEKYESGGAVMHSSNKYLTDFAEQFGKQCSGTPLIRTLMRWGLLEVPYTSKCMQEWSLGWEKVSCLERGVLSSGVSL